MQRLRSVVVKRTMKRDQLMRTSEIKEDDFMNIKKVRNYF